MAEDNRAGADGSAPRNLQGGMGLHVRRSRLQLSPHAESGDSSDVGQGRRVFADQKSPQVTSRSNQSPFPSRKIVKPEEILSYVILYFRSLLERRLAGSEEPLQLWAWLATFVLSGR